MACIIYITYIFLYIFIYIYYKFKSIKNIQNYILYFKQ